MDKTEYQLKLNELTDCVQNREYEAALKIVEEIDWNRVKSIRTLSMVADIYEVNRDYRNCKRILLLAYEKTSIGKNILYRLTEISLKLGEVEDAEKYYEQYLQVAPNDNARHILKYKLLKAADAPVQEKIRVLETYKEAEYTERWAYELAELYHKANMDKECVDACDDMILWFSEGRYVLKAMELKKQHEGLAPYQQRLYDKALAKKPEAEIPNIVLPVATKASVEATFAQAEHVDSKMVLKKMDEAGAAITKDVVVENRERAMPITDAAMDRYPVTSKEFIGKTANISLELEKSIRTVFANKEKAEEAVPYTAELFEMEKEADDLAVSAVDLDSLLEETSDELSKAVAETRAEQAESAAAEETAEETVEAPAEEAVAEVAIEEPEAAEEVVEEPAEEPEAAEEVVAEVVIEEPEAAEETAAEVVIEEPEAAEEVVEEPVEEPEAAEEAVVELAIEEPEAVEEAVAEAVIEEPEAAEEAVAELVIEEPEAAEEAVAELVIEEPEAAEEAVAELVIEEPEAAEEVAEEPVEEPEAAEEAVVELAIEEPEAVEEAVEEAVAEAPAPNADKYSMYNLELEIPDPEPTEEERKSHTIPLSKLGQNTVPISIEDVLRQETPEERRIRILNDAKPTRMNDEQRKIFTYFAKIPGMDRQILEALSGVYKYAGEHTSKRGNIAVMGAKGTGKTRLTQGLLANMCKDMGLEAAKIARVKGYAMNRRDMAEVVRQMSGGFLIIEDAGDMSAETIASLNKAMEFRTDCMIVIMEAQKSQMRALLKDYPDFAEKFNTVINIPAFTNDELVTFARTYCAENQCQMDELGVLALYTLISNNQSEEEPVTIADVKRMVDNAILNAKSSGKRFGRGRRSKGKLTILYEKDFDLV